jgi:sigma-E factor negative regulatory protein RseC
MATKGEIAHTGTVKEVGDAYVKVGFRTTSACASCRAKGHCGINDAQERVMDIPRNGDYQPGERVHIRLRESLGFRALFFGYLLPFLVLMVILVASVAAGVEEGLAGLAALGSVVLYYIILYIYRDRLDRSFSFQLSKYQ